MRRKSLALRAGVLTAVLATVLGATATAAHAEETATIAGTLTAGDGSPVAYAPVYAQGSATWGNTTTAADGSYRITGLSAGQYRVLFQPPSLPVQYAYGKSDYNQASVFDLAAGQTVTVNDTLIPTGIITGRFTTFSGAGIAFAYVNAYPLQGGSSGWATTDAGGGYTMKVAPGQYRISFRPSGGSEQWAYGKTSYSDADIVTVTADQVTTVSDSMLPTGSLTGRVVSAAGVPMAYVDVAAQSSQSSSTRTDDQGRYTFTGLRPDDYRVSVRLSSGSTMWAPQAKNQQDAGVYKVVAEQQTTLDITLLPTGTVHGRFTDNGVGVAGMSVRLSADAPAYATTDGYGQYVIRDVFTGDYKVEFSSWQKRIFQWAYGKVNQETADVITVATDTMTRVDDTRLPTGSLRITARDAVTGEVIPQFWVNMGPYTGGSTDGALVLDSIPQGTHVLGASAEWYHLLEGQTAVVTAGRQTEIELRLRPAARLDVTVVDAATGAPVPDVCVIAMEVRWAHAQDGCDRSDEAGRVTVGYRETGTYNLMAFPEQSSGYGVQWVGRNGGTGDQLDAVDVQIVDGERRTGPTIRLDRAGSITGRITSETGRPLGRANVGLLTVHGGLGGGIGASYPVAADGTYTVPGLGPYRWPLLFEAEGHADQWSGVTPNRYRAYKVQVTTGTPATFNYTMKTGTKITGKVTAKDGTELAHGRLFALNPVTGDYAAEAYVFPGQAYELWTLSPSLIKLSWDNTYWFAGVSFEQSLPLPVVRSNMWLGLCVVSDKTMLYCPDR